MTFHVFGKIEFGHLEMTGKTDFGVTEYPGGILAIDSGFGRENMTACYMVEAETEVAFIEVGANSSTPRLMATLEQRGWKPDDVRYVIVTHVHLDHAGGAGSLMQLLPNASFIVHKYGARHMLDPSNLEKGVRAVYGDAVYDELYGELIPIPEERLRVMEDGDTLNLGSRQFRFMDTQGHARHHFCVYDNQTNGWFTGDTFGLSYREFDTHKGAFVIPTTTPVQFDPPALKESVRRLVANQPDCMYLTHYGRVDDVQQLATQMLEGVDAFAEFGEQFEDDDQRTEKIAAAIWAWLSGRLTAHGVTLSEDQCRYLLQPDVKLNAQGIECWLDYRKRR
jgi:glyoxylase-like metal-dependent hydrolase (beta-lactamase superfamily II)